MTAGHQHAAPLPAVNTQVVVDSIEISKRDIICIFFQNKKDSTHPVEVNRNTFCNVAAESKTKNEIRPKKIINNEPVGRRLNKNL